ncbi:MAG: hypothetical protein ACXVP2_04745, partial [Tumebacillaceae bacterium]
KKLVRLSDSAPQVIDETTNTNGFNVITYGYGAFATDMVYSDGEIASISYGTYHGNVQLKQYSTETHQSRLLLPNVKGDQYIIAAPPSGELLVGNFVADNPSLAYTQQRTEVSGDMQLWYVNPNQPAKLVYTKKLKGEEIYRAFPSFTGDLVASTATDLLLVPDDNKVTSKSLRYQWDTQQVQEVDTEQAMQNSK